METKSRLEIITEKLIVGKCKKEIDAAWSFLRSESARLEAEMIHVSQQAQRDVIAKIGMMKAKDLAEYRTKTTLDSVNKILGKMVGDCEALARQMITANIIAGKLRATNLRVSQLNDDSIVLISNSDKERIDRLVNQVVGRIQRGASLTMSSVNTLIQNMAIRANMIPRSQSKEEPSQSKDKKDNSKDKTVTKKEEEAVKQTPLSNTVTVEQHVDKKNPQRDYKEKPITKKELESIIKDPLKYASDMAKSNVDYVNRLHEEYLKSVKNNPLATQKQRDKSKDELNGGVADKVLFELHKNLIINGLYAFIDAGGKRWTLESYCAMSTRNASYQTTNLGEIFADEEHDLYYIVPHGGCCPLCKKYEGRVYSRSGKDKRYPPLSSAFSKIDPNGTDDLDNTYMQIHPNCRHKIIKYIESSQTKSQRKAIQKKSNAPFVITKAQEKSIREYKERERVQNERDAALKEFKMYLQVMPPKEVFGNFIRFYEHKQKNDLPYRQLKKKYAEIIADKNSKK